ncbi:hypothetical protein BZA05DRAFT_100489 [Tricharina praecox]|uniref:uncharacterized protein n=1 Tax=Tricharina praecox TaxID=43433 RepID=UPI00221EC558|nr:uncharacterized protein BZA05DRAFT_100489 [Tricharina praecox]KAI5857600.1 hypothetical protein BZA05DRAFT_100489 [Tricharina praecox]
MSSPEVDVEVLVHIAAPTTAGYDNVYRAQAAATLDFVPVRRIDVGRVTWPSRRLFLVEGEEELARFRERIGEAVKRRADVEEEEEEEARPTKRACRVPIPTPTSSRRFQSSSRCSQVSTTSSANEHSSSQEPSLRLSPVRAIQLRTPRKSSQLHSEILVPQAIDRSPCLPRNPQEEEEYRSLSHAFDSFCSDLSIPDSLSQVAPSVVPRTPWFEMRADLLSPLGDHEPSQQLILESQLSQNTPSQQIRRSQRLCERHLQSTPELPSAASSQIQVPSTPHPTPISYISAFSRQIKGPVLTFATPAPDASSLVIPAHFSPVPASEISGVHSSPAQPPPFDCVCPLPTLVEPPYVIIAPLADTSSSPPQVSNSLYDLVKTQMPSKFHSRVSAITRPLCRWERGHWLVDMSIWGDPLQKVRFWRAVKDGILKGRMGCATMALETEEFADTTEMWVQGREWEAPGRREMERRGNTVKVYCWGATAEIVWCVLYIFGYHGIDGAVWVDAAGKVVVRMV